MRGILNGRLNVGVNVCLCVCVLMIVILWLVVLMIPISILRNGCNEILYTHLDGCATQRA